MMMKLENERSKALVSVLVKTYGFLDDTPYQIAGGYGRSQCLTAFICSTKYSWTLDEEGTSVLRNVSKYLQSTK